jgi:ubiquitin carboxyl-terminal hydrolase 8
MKLNKGLTGLQNLGNTCYINSIMQILSHTEKLNKVLNQLKPSTKKNMTPELQLTIEWKSLNDLMWSGNYIISPSRFINTVKEISTIKGIDTFITPIQNDANEYLMFILDAFHTSMMRPVSVNIQGKTITESDKIAMKCYELLQTIYLKEYSEIYSLFYGVSITEILDNTNQSIIMSRSYEHFSIIDLSIPTFTESSNISIYDCLNSYTKPELMEGENAWYNEKIGDKQTVYKKLYFWKLPQILIFHFKRYDNNMKKNNIFVDFPHQLDMSSYVHPYLQSTKQYKLYAVCNHIGDFVSGHYWSFVETSNNSWHLFNDSQVSECSLDKIITPMAMCLFYRLCDI